METNRLEAFSDGVIAIIITIMVLEMKVPHGHDWQAIQPLIPAFLSYVLSFIYVGIYWNNHHHLFMAAERVNGGILWANLHLLFWLSLIPFVTGWMGENHFEKIPTAAYGGVLLMAAIAYILLQRAILIEHGPDSVLRRAFRSDWKGKMSPVLYASGIALAFFSAALATLLYSIVAILWLIPDRRISRELKKENDRR